MPEPFLKIGLLEPDLVPELLKQHSKEEQSSIMNILLLTQQALPMQFGNGDSGYLVPALLPQQPEQPITFSPDTHKRIYIAPHSAKNIGVRWHYTRSELQARCHLPAGLFAHLLAQLVRLAQGSAPVYDLPQLSRSVAQLDIGAHTLILVSAQYSQKMSGSRC